MRFKRVFLFLSFAFFSCFANSSFERTDIVFISKQLGQKQVSINVELAVTSEQKMLGFMERTNIPEGTGMIFVYSSDEILHFWMKNTPHPLSIAYIDSKGKIRDIFDMKPYSLAPITSTVSVRYALEVPQGWFKKNDINVGDIVSWE